LRGGVHLFFCYHRPPDRPACLSALWINGGGDKNCGKHIKPKKERQNGFKTTFQISEDRAGFDLLALCGVDCQGGRI
jgi:hypothetical protein